VSQFDSTTTRIVAVMEMAAVLVDDVPGVPIPAEAREVEPAGR
jgi:hypothetical protein